MIAWLWLGQTVGLSTIIGGGLTLGGVALTVRDSGRLAAPATPRLAPSTLRKACVAITHGVQVQIR